MSEIDPRKQGIVTTYELASPTYDLPALPYFRWAAHELVARAPLQTGQCVLDLGTGTGEVAAAAAPKIAPGRLVAIDLSDGMLARARDKTAGLGNVEVRRHDLEDVASLPEIFDGVLGSCTLFFAADMEAALRGIVSRLAPGGFVGIAAPGARAFQPHSDAMVKVLRGWPTPVKIPEKFGWQRIPDEKSLGALLAAGGLSDVRTTTVTHAHPIDGPQAWWDFCWGSGYRALLAQLPAAELPSAQAAIAGALDALGARGGAVEFESYFGFGVKR